MKTDRPTGKPTAQNIILPINLAAGLFELVFCLPWVGTLLKWFWNSLLTIYQFLLGMLEWLAWQAGFRPLKKLRLGVVVLSGANGVPLVGDQAVLAELQRTAEYFRQAARVALIPALPQSAEPQATWIIHLDARASQAVLEVGCDLGAVFNDLHLTGMRLQWINLRGFFDTAIRRLLGLGSPVTVFIVKSIHGKVGCSLGWLTDYVTIQSNTLQAIPHEVGHACNLFHREDPENLMHPVISKEATLTSWQIAVLRASRHVSLL